MPPPVGGTWAPGRELLQEGGLRQSQAGARLGSAGGRHWGQGLPGSAKCLPSPHLLGLVPGVDCVTTLPSLATGRSWGCPGSASCGAGARVNQKLRFWGRGSPCRPHSRAAAPVRGHCAFPSTPPAAGLPALHAGDEGFHNPAQTGLKRNTQVNKSRPRNAGRAVQGVDPPGRWVRRGRRGCRGAGAMPAGAGTARDSAGSRRESRFRAALSNLIFHTSPVVKLPLSEERSCFLLFPLKSLSRSLAGRLWQDGTVRAHELRPSLPRAPAALRAPGDWPLSHRRRDNELQPGHWDKPTHGHIQLDNPVHGGELHRHHTALLGLLRLPDEECDDIGAVRVESHQQALQRAAALPGGVGRAPQPQLPQRPGGAVHLPEPPPLLPQLHPGAPGVLRPARRCAPGHDHRTHLPHPLPRHPGHLAQQGRQGAGLEPPSLPASGHRAPAAGPPDRPVGSRGHHPAQRRRPVPPAPSPPRGPGLNASPPTPGAGSSAARSLHGPGRASSHRQRPPGAGLPAASCRGERCGTRTGTRTGAAVREGRGYKGAWSYEGRAGSHRGVAPLGGRGPLPGRKWGGAGRKAAAAVPVTAAAMSFVWPWQYSFPPFFTLQPNGETRQKQLSAWCALALAYSQEHRLPAMTVREAQDIPLFANHRLQRKLPLESIQVVLEELRKNGNLEWLDKNKTSFLIMWKRPEEWGKLIYQWVSKNGLTNSVFTLYELVSGDDTENEEFHGLDEDTLLRALQALQQEHKAEIITLDDGRGVKFF